MSSIERSSKEVERFKILLLQCHSVRLSLCFQFELDSLINSLNTVCVMFAFRLSACLRVLFQAQFQMTRIEDLALVHRCGLFTSSLSEESACLLACFTHGLRKRLLWVCRNMSSSEDRHWHWLVQGHHPHRSKGSTERRRFNSFDVGREAYRWGVIFRKIGSFLSVVATSVCLFVCLFSSVCCLLYVQFVCLLIHHLHVRLTCLWLVVSVVSNAFYCKTMSSTMRRRVQGSA